jgi:hypothetical protein
MNGDVLLDVTGSAPGTADYVESIKIKCFK